MYVFLTSIWDFCCSSGHRTLGQHFTNSLKGLYLLWMCSNAISHYSTDLYCAASTRVILPSRALYYYNPLGRDSRLFTFKKTVILGDFLLTSLLSFPVVLGTAKCEFSASRWDWWACAMQTSKRSTNVSLIFVWVAKCIILIKIGIQNKSNK